MAKRKRNQAKRTTFVPRNPQKYKGSYPITLRSSWETDFATRCDLDPNILQWASEPVKIPYHNPQKPATTRRMSTMGRGFGVENAIYIPDFLVTYTKSNGSVHTELIEIKPAKEALKERSRNPLDIAKRIVNEAKWLAASAWCKRRGIKFRILTEDHLFLPKSRKVPKTANSSIKNVKTRKAKK